METNLYFVRHARFDTSIHDKRSRPLTADGFAITKRATALLAEKNITAIWSSPYKRSMDTVLDAARAFDLEIRKDDEFTETTGGSCMDRRLQGFSALSVV